MNRARIAALAVALALGLAPAVLALALAGCGGTAATGAGTGAAMYPPLTRVHDPGRVTGTMHGPCRIRYTASRQPLPDPRCTPGSYDPAVTQANLRTTICVRKVSPAGRVSYVLSAAWAAGRPPSSQTTHAKWYVVEPAYGQHNVTGELDHLVARELGGSNDETNFWVEAGRIPNPKDATEDRLHREVCTGEITLRTAQLDIAHNWTTAP